MRSMKARRWPALTSSVPVAISSFFAGSAIAILITLVTEGGEVAPNPGSRQGRGRAACG